jgi:hypothetical protein
MVLERFAFLWHCFVEVSEGHWRTLVKEGRASASEGVTLSAGTTATTTKRGATSKKGKAAAAAAHTHKDRWEYMAHKRASLALLERLVALDLDRLLLSPSERDALLNMLTKSISLLLEDGESTLRDEACKSSILDIFAHCIHAYERTGVARSVQSRMLNEYSREEGLAEFVAEICEYTVAHYDGTSVVENLVR